MKSLHLRVMWAVASLLFRLDLIVGKQATITSGAMSRIHRGIEPLGDQHDVRRRLPEFSDLDPFEVFQGLLSTPIEDWDSSQWIMVAILLLIVVWCCGCIGCARRRRSHPYAAPGYGGYSGYPGVSGPYNGGGYPPTYGMQQPRSSGFCSCLRNLVLCFCCYELCCADCKDVPCFHHSSWSGRAGHDAYKLQPGVEMV